MTSRIEPHRTVSILGLRVRERRDDLGYTQVEIAAAVENVGVYCSQARISSIETGLERRGQRVETKLLTALADALNTSTDWLLGRTDDPRPPKRSRRRR